MEAWRTSTSLSTSLRFCILIVKGGTQSLAYSTSIRQTRWSMWNDYAQNIGHTEQINSSSCTWFYSGEAGSSLSYNVIWEPWGRLFCPEIFSKLAHWEKHQNNLRQRCTQYVWHVGTSLSRVSVLGVPGVGTSLSWVSVLGVPGGILWALGAVGQSARFTLWSPDWNWASFGMHVCLVGSQRGESLQEDLGSPVEFHEPC